MSWCIRDKVGVITGAAEGIGYEMARVYLKNGAKTIVLLDINRRKGERAARILNKKYCGDRAAFCKCDVRKDLKKTYTQILCAYGRVDLLVNNAGIFNDRKPGKTIDINLKSLVKWSLKYWNHMRRDKDGCGGTIINLSSIYGFRVFPYMPVYQSANFGILGFTKALGHKDNYARSCVRVVAICPGHTKTRMTKKPKAAFYQERIKLFMKNQSWQNLDVIGKTAVDVYERAPTGTAWLIEGSCPIKEL